VSTIFAHYFFAEKLTRLSMASLVVALMGFISQRKVQIASE